MRCSICGIRIGTVDEAVEQGWTPYFFDGEIQRDPACPRCTDHLLQVDEHGEWEIKEQYRGKLTYTDEEPAGHLMIGIALSAMPGERH